MSEWIKNLFVAIFGEHSAIATLVISMIPIVELRGAIPFGAATAFWGENALPLWQSLLVSLAGSTLVCIILTFLFMPIFNWLKKTKVFKRLANWVERKLNRNAESIDKKTQEEKDKKRVLWLKLVGIFAFVAIPIPLTGVWTGTCLALFIGLNKKQTMISVILGNLVAGLIMTLISYFFADNTMIVFYAFFILVGVFIVYELIKSLIRKHKKKKQESAETLSDKESLESATEDMVQSEIALETETKIEENASEESIEEIETKFEQDIQIETIKDEQKDNKKDDK